MKKFDRLLAGVLAFAVHCGIYPRRLKDVLSIVYDIDWAGWRFRFRAHPNIGGKSVHAAACLLHDGMREMDTLIWARGVRMERRDVPPIPDPPALAVTGSASPAPPRCIGFAGRMGAGKDTAAAALVARGYRRTFFALRLKKMLLRLYPGLSWDVIEDRQAKEAPHPDLGGRSPRFVMQWVGTDLVRARIYDKTWIEGVARDVQRARSEGRGIVITDCRFPNEAEAVYAWGGRILIIEDPAGTAAAGQHVSEQGLTEIQARFPVRVLPNPKVGVDQLHRKVLDETGLLI